MNMLRSVKRFVAQTLSLPRRDSSRRLWTRQSDPRHEYRGGRRECPRHNFCSLVLAPLLFVTPLLAQAPVEVVPVQAKMIEREIRLPGEILPYLAVPIHAKVTGFVKKIDVDRGSIVKEGETLATLEAPEMQTQIVEAESKAQSIQLQRAEAEAKLASFQNTYDSLKAASATPGVVAGNDLMVAEKAMEAARASVNS